MSLPRMSRPVAARMSVALSASLFLAACGGGAEQVVEAGAQTETTPAPTTAAPTTTEAPTTTAAPETTESVTAETEAPATTAAPTTAAPTTAAPAPASQVPDVAVTNVSNGESVSLQSVAGTGTPVALWFWFPH